MRRAFLSLLFAFAWAGLANAQVTGELMPIESDMLEDLKKAGKPGCGRFLPFEQELQQVYPRIVYLVGKEGRKVIAMPNIKLESVFLVIDEQLYTPVAILHGAPPYLGMTLQMTPEHFNESTCLYQHPHAPKPTLLVSERTWQRLPDPEKPADSSGEE